MTVVGARPQFIKTAPVSALLRKKYRQQVREILVHTGQHYDRDMSDIFFRQMRLPKPKYHLGIGGGSHGAMTGRMVAKIEEVLQLEKPGLVMVYGDTNSTLAGALAAAKLHIPVAHVEAGLRSFNMRMPEEINRVLTDRVSRLLFCPTPTAVLNLKNEGIERGVVLAGDVMFDAARFYRALAMKISLQKWGLQEKDYVCCTIHRQENTDNVETLRELLRAIKKISQKVTVVFILHPRTRKVIRQTPSLAKLLQNRMFGTSKKNKKISLRKKNRVGIMSLKPLGYLEAQRMIMGARMILTDSGGLQKEAFFHGTPCVTLRKETEWPETLRGGWNQLAGSTGSKIMAALRQVPEIRKAQRPRRQILSGSRAICKALVQFLHA